MNKGVKKVRKSINQRKRIRGIAGKESSAKHVVPTYLQEEEKHGYPALFPESSVSPKDSDQRISSYVMKGILSVMLFFAVAILLQTDADIVSKPKEWTSDALTQEFPFARINKWYQESFGSPMAVSPSSTSDETTDRQLALPVAGAVSESFQANGTGIKIAPETTSTVSALREGVVIFAGNDKETGKTVVIQHADNSKSIYGFLSAINVHLYQVMDKNESIGTFEPSSENKTVYFGIENENGFIDPVQVIKVDDTP